MQRMLSFFLTSCVVMALCGIAYAEDAKDVKDVKPPVVQNPESLVPTAAQIDAGRQNYIRYCADCHGQDGEGKTGPKLVGSLIVTGPVNGQIAVVLQGEPHTKMPSWGVSEVSDGLIASIITYQRNAWGNNNRKEYGKHAGGLVTPEWVHGYRSKIQHLPVKEEVRT